MTRTTEDQSTEAPTGSSSPAQLSRRDVRPVAGLVVALVAAVALRSTFSGVLQDPAVQTWTTIFVSITVQALPFLVLGVVVSGGIAAFVPASVVARFMPAGSYRSVPVAGLAGVALPGCECGSVPIAGRLTAQGASPAAALAFMVAAPAINPVVLVATAVAFPGRPDLVAARFVASLLAAVIIGWVWQRLGDIDLTSDVSLDPITADKWSVFASTATHDLLHAGGWLVVGGMAAATLQVVVPRTVLDAVAGNEVTAILAMAVLAVVLAVCSEADAFVATGLTQFSFTSRLVFLVVGPAIDIKLIALQAAVFGRRFVLRFAPLTLVVTVVVAVLVAMVAANLTGDITWTQGTTF